MEEATITPSAKAIFATVKTVYPKYHPIWFIIYIYLIYFSIAKRKLLYHLKSVPSKFMANLLNKKYFDDINNTVAVSKENVYTHDKVLLLYEERTKAYRPVYVLPIAHCKKDEILVTYAFYHNFTSNVAKEQLTNFRLLEYREKMISFAGELDISLVNSPFDISNAIIDGVLARFFKIPKIIKTGDILEINIKYYAPEIFYRNIKINHVDSIYFKINRIKIDGDEGQEEYFCVIGHTEIKQSPNVQSYLPKKVCRQCYFTSDDDVILKEVPLCPYGLQEQLENIERSIRPFLIKSKYNIFSFMLFQPVIVDMRIQIF